MALSSSKGILVTIPVLVLSASLAAVLLSLIMSSFSSCSCGGGRVAVAGVPSAPEIGGDAAEWESGETTVVEGGCGVGEGSDPSEWFAIRRIFNVLRKGINPRTRAQQLRDLLQYKGISYYEGSESITLPSVVLVSSLLKNITVTMVSLGQVGEMFFCSLLNPVILSLIRRFLRLAVVLSVLVCISFAIFVLEISTVSKETNSRLLAAFRYELPSQGLLRKRPFDCERWQHGLLLKLMLSWEN